MNGKNTHRLALICLRKLGFLFAFSFCIAGTCTVDTLYVRFLIVPWLLLSIYGHSPSCNTAPNVWNTQQSSAQPKNSLAGSWCSSPSSTATATPLAAHSLALISPYCWGKLAVTATVLAGTWESPRLEHVSQQAFTWGCCSSGELQLREHLAWQAASIVLPPPPKLPVTNVMASWRSCFLPHFFLLPTELATIPSLLHRHPMVPPACGEVAPQLAWHSLPSRTRHCSMISVPCSPQPRPAWGEPMRNLSSSSNPFREPSQRWVGEFCKLNPASKSSVNLMNKAVATWKGESM